MTTSRSNDSVRRTTAQAPAGAKARTSTARRQSAASRDAGGGDDFSNLISVSIVVDFLRRWWLIATPIGLLLAGGAAAYLLVTFSPVYMATNLLLIQEEKPFVIYPEPVKSGTFANNQIQMIRSRLVLGSVVLKPEIAALPEITQSYDPVSWLAQDLSITNAGVDSDYFQIGLALQNGENAAKIVDAVSAEYIDMQRAQELEQSKILIDTLETERNAQQAAVEESRQVLRQEIFNVTGRESLAANASAVQIDLEPTVVELQKQLNAAQVETMMMLAQKKVYEDRLSGEKVEIDPLTLQHTLETHEQVVLRRAVIAEKRAKLQGYLKNSRLKEKDPAYIRLTKEIETDEKGIELVKTDLEGQIRAGLARTVGAQTKSELAALDEAFKIQAAEEAELKRRYDAELTKAKEGSNSLLAVEFARAELARQENVFEMISTRLMELKTEQTAPERVKEIQAARASAAPVEMAPFKKLGVASAVGFFLPFALIFIWERTLRRISDARSLEKQVRLPVIGEISTLPARQAYAANTSSSRRNRELNLFRESINSLRTYLMLSQPVEGMQVLSVNSAITSEGKSSVSAQLAVSLAQATGDLTLLIDGDVRMPDAHDIFGCQLGPGLVEVLQGRVKAEDAIVRDLGGNVHVLPAGKLSASPHTLFGGENFARLLDELRGAYRHIIVDTPPVLAASESLVIAKEADACLLCTMRDVSRIDQVKAAFAKLEASGANPVGVVLNGVPMRQYAYYYGGYGYAAS